MKPFIMKTFFCLAIACSQMAASNAILYPRTSSTREQISLDGIWGFETSPSLDPQKGFREKWFEKSSLPSPVEMPVPSSFNDITADASLRDFVGWAWYQRHFQTPQTWIKQDKRIFIRFGSVHYSCKVWLNGRLVLTHEGGHLPFEKDVTHILRPHSIVTVAVNNTLTPTTIPQGEWRWKNESESYPAGYFDMYYSFDFFNYAGIHRPVTLYAVPKEIMIEDIAVETADLKRDLSEATLKYHVSVKIFTSDSSNAGVACDVELVDKDLKVVSASKVSSGHFKVSEPNLWWPFLTHPNPGYMYTLRVSVMSRNRAGETIRDVYELPVGIRFVSWDKVHFKINHREFYFRGFGKHEDSNIRGKGLDLATLVKDFNLIKWLGANSFRTSHYPYSEETLQMADRQGIVIIDECPAVNLHIFDRKLRNNHMAVMKQLIARDKNHPSVVMWSIGNEPRSEEPAAKDYFSAVANFTRSLDRTRPLILVVNSDPKKDQGLYSVDIIGLNRYHAWYSDTGRLELIERQLTADFRNFRKQFDKPVLMTEYGADTIHGFHETPSTIFTEEFQTDLMRENFRGFDAAKSEKLLIGEMIWNFADFMTKQEYHRAWGNRKGIFTRDRHPKASAHILRKRYHAIKSAEGHVLDDSQISIDILD